MSVMRDHLVITWLAQFTVVVLLLATMSVMYANSAGVRHCHHAPAPICEHLECDNPDKARLENVIPSAITSPPHPKPITLVGLRVRHLSPNIFQPPEAA
jgi:hypothetical protein